MLSYRVKVCVRCVNVVIAALVLELLYVLYKCALGRGCGMRVVITELPYTRCSICMVCENIACGVGVRYGCKALLRDDIVWAWYANVMWYVKWVA